MAYKKPIAEKINKAKEIKNLLEQAYSILGKEFIYETHGHSSNAHILYDSLESDIRYIDGLIHTLKSKETYVVGNMVVIKD